MKCNQEEPENPMEHNEFERQSNDITRQGCRYNGYTVVEKKKQKYSVGESVIEMFNLKIVNGCKGCSPVDSRKPVPDENRYAKGQNRKE